MRVMKHNDNAIRMIDTFKKYNQFLSEVVEDSDDYRVIRGVEGAVYCGVFVVRLYIGTRLLGTYEFDCRHWANILNLSPMQMKPRLRKIR